MLPRNVPQSRCSTSLHYLVPVYPSAHVSHIPQSLCFPVPMLSSPCALQSICFPVPINVHQSLCSQVPMFPKLIHQSLCYQLLFHRSFHPLYSPNMFPSPYVPQCLCSPKMFPSPYDPPTSSAAPMFPVLFHRSVFHSLCSPNMFPSPYVPQWAYGLGNIFGEHKEWKHLCVTYELANIFGKKMGLGTVLAKMGSGNIILTGAWGLGNKGTAEHRDCGT